MKATTTLAWILLGMLLGPVGLAQARPYTLAAPIVISGTETGNPGVIGTVEAVALGGTLSDPRSLEIGNTASTATDLVVLRLVLAAGSVPVELLELAVASTPFFGNPVGAGAFADSGATAPGAVSLPAFGFRADFDFGSAPLAAGESSARLFVTVAPEGSALATGRTASITLSSGTNFTVQGTIVPEPTTGALLALGLAALATRRRAAPTG